MTMRHSAGGAGNIEEPERGEDRQVEDPLGRPEPYVKGPTGSAPLSSELRGDPGSEGDRGGEGGAAAGAITGTSLAGPVGGVVGALAGGAIGTASIDDEDTGWPHDPDREHDSGLDAASEADRSR